MARDGASGIRTEDHLIIAIILLGDLQHNKSGKQFH